MPDRGAPQFWAAGGASIATFVAVYADPIEAPRSLGTLGVALLAVTGMFLVLHLLGTVGARRLPKGFLAQPWLPKTVPLVAFLAIWTAVAWWWHGKHAVHIHQARTVEKVKVAPLSLEDAVASWLARQSHMSGNRVPMLLVAASGGGAKAAYWTDLVLDCVFGSGEPPQRHAGECPAAKGRDHTGSLFLTSSVSGGSVGIYHYIRSHSPVKSWVDEAAGPEVLSPTVAWGLLHDLPIFLFGADTDPRKCNDAESCWINADRALVQEAAVAGLGDGIVPPKGGGLLAAHAEGKPVTVFNAALDGAEGRVLLSPLSLAPPWQRNPWCRTPWTGEPVSGAMDGHDLLNRQREDGLHQPRRFVMDPGQDVPLVTAALLSARFPVVAPAARLGDTKSRIAAATSRRSIRPSAFVTAATSRTRGSSRSSKCCRRSTARYRTGRP